MLSRAGQARASPADSERMKELLRTNDWVRLSWLQALLAGVGIETVVLDTHASIVEGSIGAIQRRLMVADADLKRARAALAEAGEEGM
jgi:hypothetical protein